MNDIVAVALMLIWVAFNFYLWTLKQSQVTLFWQSSGMGAAWYPAFFWYVTRTTK